MQIEWQGIDMQGNDVILSVKDLNQMVKDLLSDAIGQVWLLGEISNFSKPVSGHWYFTLKDELAQVRCAMFRNSNIRTKFSPKNGQQVLVKASVTLYEARGEYQIIVESMQPAGAGLLQQRFEQLKQQLQEEGLFEPQRKRPLPTNIRTVGVVTSSTGAALHDIRQILKRRDPSMNIIIYPTQVQGSEAASQIAHMISLANMRQECDVLIVGRGGGSLEDLWPFNEEVVARAIVASRIPIISAVGHEVDFTIGDFVADLRAATPSAAAEIVSKDQQEQLRRLKAQEQHLLMAMDYFLVRKKEQYHHQKHQLHTQHPQVKLISNQKRLIELQKMLSQHISRTLTTKSYRINMLDRRLLQLSPLNEINQYTHKVKQYSQKVIMQIKHQLIQSQHALANRATRLESVSPLSTLARGYSITSNMRNEVIHQPSQVQLGEQIVTQLEQGQLISQITQILEHKDD